MCVLLRTLECAVLLVKIFGLAVLSKPPILVLLAKLWLATALVSMKRSKDVHRNPYKSAATSACCNDGTSLYVFFFFKVARRPVPLPLHFSLLWVKVPTGFQSIYLITSTKEVMVFLSCLFVSRISLKSLLTTLKKHRPYCDIDAHPDFEEKAAILIPKLKSQKQYLFT